MSNGQDRTKTATEEKPIDCENCRAHLAMIQADDFNRSLIECQKRSMKESESEQWKAIHSKINARVFWTVVVLILGFIGSIAAIQNNQTNNASFREVRVLEKLGELELNLSKRWHEMHEEISILQTELRTAIPELKKREQK